MLDSLIITLVILLCILIVVLFTKRAPVLIAYCLCEFKKQSVSFIGAVCSLLMLLHVLVFLTLYYQLGALYLLSTLIFSGLILYKSLKKQ
jgi:hypothetical protein